MTQTLQRTIHGEAEDNPPELSHMPARIRSPLSIHVDITNHGHRCAPGHNCLPAQEDIAQNPEGQKGALANWITLQMLPYIWRPVGLAGDRLLNVLLLY